MSSPKNERPRTPLAWSRWATELARALMNKEWRVADAIWSDGKGALGPFLRNAAQANALPEAEWIVGKMLEEGIGPSRSFSLMQNAPISSVEHWDATGRWSSRTAGELRYAAYSSEFNFSQTDVAVFNGSEAVLGLLLRSFPQELDSGRWSTHGSISIGGYSPGYNPRTSSGTRVVPRAVGGPGGSGSQPPILTKVGAALKGFGTSGAPLVAEKIVPRQEWKFTWEGPHWLGSLAGIAAISPVLNADDAKSEAIFKRLERAGVDVWATQKSLSTPLALACLLGMHNTALRLATREDWRSSGGRLLPLSVCARFNEIDLVDWLLEAGENVDRCAKGEPPPVWIACASGHKELTQKFIDAGARLDITWDGEAFVDFAQRQGFALPRASLERDALQAVMKESAEKAKKKKKKAFAQEKRKLAEEQGLSVEEAGVFLRQKAAEEALKKEQEERPVAPRPRSRRL